LPVYGANLMIEGLACYAVGKISVNNKKCNQRLKMFGQNFAEPTVKIS